jgi:hypothetical protein
MFGMSEAAQATIVPPKKRRSRESAERARHMFLRALEGGATVVQAVAQTTYSRMQFYTWRRQMPEFAAAWDEARFTLLGELEQRARDIALGPVTPQSTLLLMFLMKSIAPETYCETVRAAKYRAKLEKESGNPNPQETEARRKRIVEILSRVSEVRRAGFDLKTAAAIGSSERAALANPTIRDTATVLVAGPRFAGFMNTLIRFFSCAASARAGRPSLAACG